MLHRNIYEAQGTQSLELSVAGDFFPTVCNVNYEGVTQFGRGLVWDQDAAGSSPVALDHFIKK